MGALRKVMTFKTKLMLCWLAGSVVSLSGCMLPPLAPVADITRANGRTAEGTSDFDDPSTTPPTGQSKSLGNVLVDVETMKRVRPDDYTRLKQLLDATPDTMQPQHQQMYQDQLRAIAAHQAQAPPFQAPPFQASPLQASPLQASPLQASPLQTSPVQASSLQTPPITSEDVASVPSVLPASSVAARPPEFASPTQADSLTSPKLLRSGVAAHVGDIEVASATTDTSVSVPSTDTKEAAFQSGQWRKEMAAALDALEAELFHGKHDREAKARLESYRRLLHVVANHTDEAVLPIKELSEDEQEFWKHQLHSLLIALDADQKHAASRRAALALRDLRTASHHLANISALDLRNVTFCTKVNSYGEFTEFDSYAFRPSEEVILYVEIDNFAAHPKGERYETELHGSYQILDDAGRRVANVVLPVDQQVSNNRRRDYFIPYLITMPAQIDSGSYRLQLAIEDVIGKKSNHASIDFRIR